MLTLVSGWCFGPCSSCIYSTVVFLLNLSCVVQSPFYIFPDMFSHHPESSHYHIFQLQPWMKKGQTHQTLKKDFIRCLRSYRRWQETYLRKCQNHKVYNIVAFMYVYLSTIKKDQVVNAALAIMTHHKFSDMQYANDSRLLFQLCSVGYRVRTKILSLNHCELLNHLIFFLVSCLPNSLIMLSYEFYIYILL